MTETEKIPLANRRYTALGVVIPFAILSIITVSLRLYTRLLVLNRPGWDDAAIVLALICVVVGAVFVCLSLDCGFGKHFASLSYEAFSEYLFRFYMSNGAYIMSTALTKLSLLLQYLRVYTNGRIRIVCITWLAIIGMWGAVYSFMGWFPCFPVRDYWEWQSAGEHCYAFGARHPTPFYATYLSHGIFNAIFDVAVFLCSLPMCLRNDRSKQEKLGIVFLLILGSWIVSISFWRLATVIDHHAGWQPTLDFTWYGPPTILLSSLEVFCGLIAASCPVFWPVIQDTFNHIFVTQVVEVRTYDRNGLNELELQCEGLGSLHGSQRSLQRKNSINTLDYYQDAWVMEHVNPLQDKDGARVSNRPRPSAI